MLIGLIQIVIVKDLMILVEDFGLIASIGRF